MSLLTLGFFTFGGYFHKWDLPRQILRGVNIAESSAILSTIRRVGLITYSVVQRRRLDD